MNLVAHEARFDEESPLFEPDRVPMQETGEAMRPKSAPSPAVVRCRGLSVRYGDNPVLRPLDFDAEVGEWIGLLGPNGAGKSSALRAFLGVLRGRSVAIEGDIEVGGVSLHRVRPRDIGRLVAFVPQLPVIPDGIAVEDYALLGRTPHLGWFGAPGASDRAIVAELLERLDLTEFRRRDLASLSGGERQRALIARALAQQAPVLLLDEPTSALDVGHQQQVLDLLDDLRRERGLVVIAAMHDLSLAGQYAHRLILLVNGVAVSSGAPGSVLTEAGIASAYGARVRTVHLADGQVAVLPVRSTH